jgi:N-acetylneuraminate synthase
MKKEIKIENKFIGENHPCFIIAEAGVNHNGSLTLAKKLVDVAVDAGVDAVKFQTFKTEDLVTKKTDMAKYQKNNTKINETQFEMLKKLELNENDFIELKNYCDKKNIIFMSTPHTDSSIDFLDSLMPAFKIGSGDVTNIPLLEKVAKKGNPIILSVGMANLEEVRLAVNSITKFNNDLILLHCTTNYPCPRTNVNLSVMDTLKKEFGLLVGYSDHTEGINISIMAANYGAQLVEKHFTLDKNMEGPDHKASLNPNELKEMVKKIRENKKIDIPEEILGSTDKIPTKEEIEIAKVARKSIVALVNIPKGTIITKDMLTIKRPGIGLSPSKLYDVIGKKTLKNIERDELIKLNDLE